MTKHKNYQKISPETQGDAMKAAKATQRPGQTKEQTKLIALGIEKGINHYKKQQKERSRELSRRLQKASKLASEASNEPAEKSQVTTTYKLSVVPWGLLIASWLGFAVYVFL